MNNAVKKELVRINNTLEGIRDRFNDLSAEEQELFDELDEEEQDSEIGSDSQELIDNLDVIAGNLDEVIDIISEYTDGVELDEDDNIHSECNAEVSSVDVNGTDADNNQSKDDILKWLKKNTILMKKTFSAHDMEVLSYSYLVEGNTLNMLVEVDTEDEPELDDFTIKINLYNAEGEIIDLHEEWISEFSGYDTFKINLGNWTKIKNTVKKARIYLSTD